MKKEGFAIYEQQDNELKDLSIGVMESAKVLQAYINDKLANELKEFCEKYKCSPYDLQISWKSNGSGIVDGWIEFRKRGAMYDDRGTEK